MYCKTMWTGIKNKRQVWISRCDDVGENEGGYYCQVYSDSNMENEIDNFVIQAEDVKKDDGYMVVALYLDSQPIMSY